MNHRGPNSNDAFDSEESSGVTTMAPVPAKTARLSELEESDRTAYFSVTALMERGKAVAERAEHTEPPAVAQSAPPPAPLAPEATPAAPRKPGIVQQLRDASPARKATLVVMPMLIALLALAPAGALEEQTPPTVSSAPASVSSASAASIAHPQQVAESDPKQLLAPTPAEPLPSLPKGTTMERAAADALVAGDYPRALGFYRELSRRQPEHAAYREATRILERRQREKQP